MVYFYNCSIALKNPSFRQSHKEFTIIIYDSRVIVILKLPTMVASKFTIV